MIKKTVSILFILLIIFMATACIIFNNPVKYKKVYSGAFGFSETKSEPQNPPEKDIYIFNSEKDWTEFANTHLNKLRIPNLDFNNKKVLYVQCDWSEPLSGSEYAISSIKIDNNKLNVTVRKENMKICVSANKGIFFKYITICTIDKSSVNDNIIPELMIKK